MRKKEQSGKYCDKNSILRDGDSNVKLLLNNHASALYTRTYEHYTFNLQCTLVSAERQNVLIENNKHPLSHTH